MKSTLQAEPLMTTGEVAALFRVTRNTVRHWIAQGKLSARWTPGGHRRCLTAEVVALAAQAGIEVR